MTNLPKEELLPYINGSWDYQNDNYRVEKIIVLWMVS